MFSCDIAYSDSPAASACSTSKWYRLSAMWSALLTAPLINPFFKPPQALVDLTNLSEHALLKGLQRALFRPFLLPDED